MADEQDLAVDEEQGDKRVKWWLVGAGGIALAAVLITLSIIWFKGGAAESRADSEVLVAVDRNAAEARYVSIPRNLTFNVPGAGRDRIAQIGVQLLVRGAQHESLAQENIPLLESTLLSTFSRTSAERLTTQEGKREIRLQALDAVQEALYEATGDPIVEEVLFTNFVVQ